MTLPIAMENEVRPFVTLDTGSTKRGIDEFGFIAEARCNYRNVHSCHRCDRREPFGWLIDGKFYCSDCVDINY